jgi:hypothetical protein
MLLVLRLRLLLLLLLRLVRNAVPGRIGSIPGRARRRVWLVRLGVTVVRRRVVRELVQRIRAERRPCRCRLRRRWRHLEPDGLREQLRHRQRACRGGCW